MPSNAEEKGKDDVVPVGESIQLGGSNSVDSGDANANGASNSAPDDKPRAPRRKRVGQRILQLRERVESGVASDSDKAEYEDWQAKQRAKEKSETPPKVESEPKRDDANRDTSWRAKYGDYNGRELLCASLGEFWHGATMRMSEYIVDNGGKPFIDGRDEEKSKRWYGILVLAVDEILPPHVTAAPKLVAAVGTSAMLVQAALTANEKRSAKKPQQAKPTPAEEIKRAEEAKDANPPEDNKDKTPKAHSKERPRDKDGNEVW